MFDLYEESLKDNYRRVECDGLLFVEYKCIPNYLDIDSLWSPCGHLVYVTSGKKTWITPEGELPTDPGEAVYCKKGACLMRNYYEKDFCALILFFPQDFIQEVMREYQVVSHERPGGEVDDFHVLRINMDHSLKIFFESVSAYLFQRSLPSKHLLKLKFKELILQIMTTDQNPGLKSYFISTLREGKESIETMVRKNLFFNLSISDYARLCNRSLSSFNREFKDIFGLPPLQWITRERLQYAKMRLLTSDENINDIAFHAGFESPEHFIRLFKKQYGLPPLRYKLQEKL